MSYVVLDLETSINCPIGDMPAHPAWDGNDVVYVGMYDSSKDTLYTKRSPFIKDIRDAISKHTMVVGHNIKFDLSYIYRPEHVLPTIWDTQLAEYLLTGQQNMYASLDELTRKYVGEHAIKDDKIKQYWKDGVRTEDIPEAEIVPYLIGDVTNTRLIFEAQMAQAMEANMMPLMMTQMDALRATTAMAIAGMQLDTKYINSQFSHYNTSISALEKILADAFPDVDHRSNKELSLYFFGGEQKYQEREHVGFYKNGKPKTKLVDKVRIIPAVFPPIGDKGASGYYSVDDTVLLELRKRGSTLASSVLELRKQYKIRDTYYAGLIGLVFPDGRVYPQLNHCATKTGRLSSNKPNLQNQTDAGDVKRAYVSRFGDKGVILELDYSQLEMVALAFIAEDKQLISDINNGRDMHRELYKEMYGRYPTDAERKPFKRFSFLLVYGGGASTLMAQSGCDRATAKRFIDTFYKRYTGVKTYHEKIVKEAATNKEVFYTATKSGPQYRYTLVTPTKRKYVFTAYPNDRTGDMQFSPTELKNWPIQGFATGDVVPMMVGKLQRKLDEMGVVQKQQAHLVMTVHDSVILDVHTDVLYNVASEARDVLQSAPEQIKKHFGIDFPCKLSVGVDVGYNWQDTEEYEM